MWIDELAVTGTKGEVRRGSKRERERETERERERQRERERERRGGGGAQEEEKRGGVEEGINGGGRGVIKTHKGKCR